MTRLSVRALPGRRPVARRALRSEHSSWLQRGIAVLAVSALGVGVAGSMALNGAATSSSHSQPAPQPSVITETVPGVVVPDAFDARSATTSRGNARPPVAGASAAGLASAGPASSANRAQASTPAGSDASPAADPSVLKHRKLALKSASSSISKLDHQLVEKRKLARAAAAAAARIKAAKAAKAAATRGCVPVIGGYSIAARFGDVGSWARYHTGFDFSAAMGTGLRAPTAGTVMNAGSGPASGWAGNYVVIKQADGTQVLMAHMSQVNVSVGQHVSACDSVGAVGQTGRAFGPHLHFEVYPAGITPGDVYSAVDPLPWLTKMGIKP